MQSVCVCVTHTHTNPNRDISSTLEINKSSKSAVQLQVLANRVYQMNNLFMLMTRKVFDSKRKSIYNSVCVMNIVVETFLKLIRVYNK